MKETASFPSNIYRTSVTDKRKCCLNLNCRSWILKRPLLYIVIAWHYFYFYFSPMLCLLPSLLPFSASFHSRRNSYSEDEESGSGRGSAIFSRMPKAEHRLDSNYQRRSLLMELATEQARNSRDTHAARSARGTSDEPRCTPAYMSLPALSLACDTFPRLCCYINLRPWCAEP